MALSSSYLLVSGIRSLARRPSLFVGLLLTAAGGLSAFAAAFVLYSTAAFQPLPYGDSHGLVFIGSPQEGSRIEWVNSYPDFDEWRDSLTSFDAVTGFAPASFSIEVDGITSRVPGAAVEAGFFDALGVLPQRGTFFTSSSDALSIVVSHSFAQKFLRGEAVIGSPIRLSGRQYNVVGVTPDEFRHPEPLAARDAMVWRLLSAQEVNRPRGLRWIRVLGRLKDGVVVEQAASELRAIAQQGGLQFPDSNGRRTSRVGLLRDVLFAESRGVLATVLWCSVPLVLIAAVNLSNLFATRMLERQQELVLRSRLGAPAWHLWLWLLTEPLWIGVTAGLCAVGLAALYIGTFRTSAFAEFIPLIGESSIAWRPIVSIVAIGMVVTVAAAMPSVAGALMKIRRGSHGVPQHSRYLSIRNSRTRAILIACQFSLTLPIVSAAVVMAKDQRQLLSTDPGFAMEGVAAVSFSRAATVGRRPDNPQALLQAFIPKVRQIPGVTGVSIASAVPFGIVNVEYTQDVIAADGEPVEVFYRVVTPDFFSVLRIPLRLGRLPSSAGGAGEAVVNETFIRQLYGSSDSPLGRVIRVVNGRPVTAPLTIVGVASDVRMLSLGQRPAAEMYVTFETDPWDAVTALVKTSIPLEAVSPHIKANADVLRPWWGISSITPLSEFVSESLKRQRFMTALALLLSLVSITLSLIGIGSLVSSYITSRSSDCAIRLALGASCERLRADLIKRVGLLLLYGCLAGLFVAALAFNMIQSTFLGMPEVSNVDLLLAAIILLSFGMAILVSGAGKLRHLDPSRILRSDQ